MDMEAMGKSILAGEHGKDLQKLTSSPEGRRLSARFDGAAIEAAARRGDMEELRGLLKDILSTEEGRAFAGQVIRAVGKNGQ